MDNSTLSQSRLRELLHYDRDSGEFSWTPKALQVNGRKTETPGSITNYGYRIIRVDYRKYFAHRLAWFYITGKWPVAHIDHIDGVRMNNRFANLRESNSTLNRQNLRKPRKGNQSGFLGVSPHRRKWVARICINFKQYRMGPFNTPQEAHQAYIEAKRRLHPFGTL